MSANPVHPEHEDHFSASVLIGDVYVRLNAPSMASLADVLGRLRPVAPANDKAVKADKPKTDKPKAEPEAKKEEAKSPEPEAEVAERKEEPGTPTFTLDDVRKRIGVFTDKAGREATIAALQKFKVTRASEMDPRQFPAFMAYLDEVQGVAA